jgi:hypothetical protein
MLQDDLLDLLDIVDTGLVLIKGADGHIRLGVLENAPEPTAYSVVGLYNGILLINWLEVRILSGSHADQPVPAGDLTVE